MSNPIRIPELPTRAAVIEEAAKYGIELKSHEITGREPELYIDGMPANQWLDAMTMD